MNGTTNRVVAPKRNTEVFEDGSRTADEEKFARNAPEMAVAECEILRHRQLQGDQRRVETEIPVTAS
jgi:hypothetical protein